MGPGSNDNDKCMYYAFAIHPCPVGTSHLGVVDSAVEVGSYLSTKYGLDAI